MLRSWWRRCCAWTTTARRPPFSCRRTREAGPTGTLSSTNYCPTTLRVPGRPQLTNVQSTSCPTRHSLAGSSVEDWEGEPGTSQMGGLRPGRERDRAAQQRATAPGGREWGADSLERALELELDIQEADLRAVRPFLIDTLGTYNFAAPILGTRHCSDASCPSEGLAQQGITQESSFLGWEADMRSLHADMQAQAEQHAQQAEMHVHLLQEAKAALAAERGALLQRAVEAERALGSEREALVHRALTAERATCALMEQHARDAEASRASLPIC